MQSKGRQLLLYRNRPCGAGWKYRPFLKSGGRGRPYGDYRGRKRANTGGGHRPFVPVPINARLETWIWNCPICAVNMSECVGKEAAAETPDEPEQTEESGGGIGGIILLPLSRCLAAAGALYYFKVMKPKQAAKEAPT